MYYIIVYDVEIKRINKLHKYLKRYMNWIQNSVFEGELGKADFATVKKYIKRIIDKEKDSVLIFELKNKHCYEKMILGKERNPISNVI